MAPACGALDGFVFTFPRIKCSDTSVIVLILSEEHMQIPVPNEENRTKSESKANLYVLYKFEKYIGILLIPDLTGI